MLVWSIFLGLVALVGLQRYISQADPVLPGAVYALNIAMQLSVVAYLVVIAATVVVRDAAGGEGARYRAAAFGTDPRSCSRWWCCSHDRRRPLFVRIHEI